MLWLITIYLSIFSIADINLSDYENFEKDWKFVTVRYRKDSNEMRFTYANAKAWDALLKNKKRYPDGAVFAKIGMSTVVDHAFPSSAVPAGKRRIQFMVRDEVKYKDTDGWGYALFEPNGVPFKGDRDARSYACAACHKIVENQGGVFSKPMGANFEYLNTQETWKQYIKIKNIPSSEAPLWIQKYISTKKVKNVIQLSGDIEEHLFSGTLDEVRPLMSKVVLKEKIPAFLSSKDGKNFIVLQVNSSSKCTSEETGITSWHTVDNASKPIYEISYCEKNQ